MYQSEAILSLEKQLGGLEITAVKASFDPDFEIYSDDEEYVKHDTQPSHDTTIGINAKKLETTLINEISLAGEQNQAEEAIAFDINPKKNHFSGDSKPSTAEVFLTCDDIGEIIASKENDVMGKHQPQLTLSPLSERKLPIWLRSSVTGSLL